MLLSCSDFRLWLLLIERKTTTKIIGPVDGIHTRQRAEGKGQRGVERGSAGAVYGGLVSCGGRNTSPQTWCLETDIYSLTVWRPEF